MGVFPLLSLFGLAVSLKFIHDSAVRRGTFTSPERLVRLVAIQIFIGAPAYFPRNAIGA